MIITDCEQGSEEWYKSRLSVVTASEFNRIVTPKGLKTDTTTQNSYFYQLLGEWLSGKPEDSYTNDHMERGKEVEEEARNWLQMYSDIEFTQTGLIYLNNKKTIGASPDGLARKNRTGCEIKCPKASTQAMYLDLNRLPSIYYPQVQGAMWITGYKRWYFLSYHPDTFPLIIIIKRDNNYIAQLEKYIFDFVGRLENTKKDFINRNLKDN